MSVRQTFNPDEVNLIINHPDVFPHVADGLPYPLDCTELMNGRNIFLTAEGGGMCLIWIRDDVYEGHYYFLPDFRGKSCINEGRNALKWCANHGISIIGRTPINNRPARIFNTRIGMRAVRKDDEVEIFEWP